MVENKFRKGMQVIITGTLDFGFNPNFEREASVVDRLTPHIRSVVPEFLSKRVKMRSSEIDFYRACMKDSRELTDEDRAAMVNQAAKSPYQNILITHGIAEIAKTKKYFEAHAKQLEGKVIGIVGSRMPLVAHCSDAGFMLGYATARLQAYQPSKEIHSFHPDVVRDSVQNAFSDTVVLITGGTIDSCFNEAVDTSRPYEHSQIPSYFRDVIGVDVPEENGVFREICMKDSRELTRRDIHNLLEESRRNGHKRQIITAGTYALPDLAGRFAHELEKGNLPETEYGFIGSMFPEDVRLNDGWFNLGFIMGKMDLLEKKVHVSMHGWATSPVNVLKQLQEARFDLHDYKLRV